MITGSSKCYIYSVREGDNRLATVELVRKQGEGDPAKFGQPACNAEPSKDVKIAVRKWVSELRAA
jgi:hypothetical protein